MFSSVVVLPVGAVELVFPVGPVGSVGPVFSGVEGDDPGVPDGPVGLVVPDDPVVLVFPV